MLRENIGFTPKAYTGLARNFKNEFLDMVAQPKISGRQLSRIAPAHDMDSGSTHFLHIATGIDVAPLRAALLAKPQLFGQHRARADSYQSPHAGMTDIWVRYNQIDNLGPRFNDEHDAVWYPAYAELPELKAILFPLMAFVEGERLGGVLITKLPPGGEIALHVDAGWHAGYYEKFYIALQNGPGALFHFPSGDLVAQPGDLFWFDNSVPHGVTNGADADRLALIVCIKTDLFKGLRHG